MAVRSRIVLEPSAQGVVDATSKPPFLYELEPAAARKVLERRAATCASPNQAAAFLRAALGTDEDHGTGRAVGST